MKPQIEWDFDEENKKYIRATCTYDEENGIVREKEFIFFINTEDLEQEIFQYFLKKVVSALDIQTIISKYHERNKSLIQ